VSNRSSKEPSIEGIDEILAEKQAVLRAEREKNEKEWARIKLEDHRKNLQNNLTDALAHLGRDRLPWFGENFDTSPYLPAIAESLLELLKEVTDDHVGQMRLLDPPKDNLDFKYAMKILEERKKLTKKKLQELIALDMAFIKPIQLLCNQVWLRHQHFPTKASVAEAQKRADQERMKLLEASSGQADKKADKPKKNRKLVPDNPKVAELARRINLNLGRDFRSKIEIARDYTDNDEAEAQKLLRELRRFPNLLNDKP
jgi:hypothetical protein